ncbi:alpha-methylacyl-CoA racemase [Oceaniovalibus guishaninsula JLT2003]|uniref:Alpha-methylacyl-CoA racemase n=1 Tax=Oceaniovalibus guishaninsula JLT2003 TaxID=1231392 RepID=K2H9E8_9RHOB|nr:CaiB/BaiF CoA-transferase family protein [Oceaniovalibus guishaninsula]EKE43232.1 alpha-methylacyl-CoA racemase [Oceaniovalibus guishaninsula JLT2003]
MNGDRAGPLAGLRIVEFAGIGPGPFAAMMLADMGADIVRIARPGDAAAPDDPILRGRRGVALDLKSARGRDAALHLIGQADGLIEGFRPGVMERLSLGPEACHAVNPRLVYGRMTGWGQTGPLARAAGHDINYLALSGALWSTGEAGRPPVAPLNLLGDYGAGAMLLVAGMLAALLAAARTGQGNVIDAAICDGSALLMTMFYDKIARGEWEVARQSNRLDGGAPFYGVYECADGRWISLAPLEPQFHALFLSLLGLPDEDAADRHDKARWPARRAEFAAIFRRRTRDEWCALFEGTDVCFAPVLDPDEAPGHPHNRARAVFTHDPVTPAPAPRFGSSPAPRRAPLRPVAWDDIRDWPPPV